MTTPLLLTKLYIPPTRSNLVRRPLLLDRLNNGLQQKLTLISAPAGFGKTTLISEWVNAIQMASRDKGQPKTEIAWLSLGKADNDPIRFLRYFIATLNQIENMDDSLGKQALALLQSSESPPMQTALISLINEVVAADNKIILILDDYHLIEAQPVHDALTFWLENQPPNFHLAIASREDPLLPLARLRGRGQLTEIRAADLRFTIDEASEFLNKVMELNLSPDDISALEMRTEGWIAGLQLAALSLKGHLDTSELIKSFAGSHRLVLDYLVEEVLEQQPKNIQTFLLQTAILNRLNGSLCNALTGQNTGQQTLETLERLNLFIVPLDNERQWYRYHQLFAELLCQRLESTTPETIPDLHAKAVIWYESNGYVTEAVKHALSGGDIPTALRLIEIEASTALDRGELGVLFRHLSRLPEDAQTDSPWLYVYHTYALLFTGRLEEAKQRLADTDWLLESMGSENKTKSKRMQGYVAGMKSMLFSWQRDSKRVFEAAGPVFEFLPENHWVRSYAGMALGTAYWGTGDLEKALETFRTAAAEGQASGNQRAAVTGAVYIGHTLELQGRLREALAMFKESFYLAEIDGRKTPLAGYLHTDYSRVLYEVNELDTAVEHMLAGVQACQQLSDGRIEKLCLNQLVRGYLAQGDIDAAEEALQAAKEAHSGTGLYFDMRGADFPQVWIWLKQNKLEEIDIWLTENEVHIDETENFKARLIFTMHARAMIKLGQTRQDNELIDRGLEIAEKVLKLAEVHGWEKRLVECLGLKSLGLQAKDDVNSALAVLTQALERAQPSGFVRTFVDEGLPMKTLLQQVSMEDEPMKIYVGKLIAAFPEKKAQDPASIPQPLIEPLSEREIEVLNLIADGLTNQEIADKLFLSLNTIKVHIRNIFGKLGVHHRTSAVAKARDFGILISD